MSETLTAMTGDRTRAGRLWRRLLRGTLMVLVLALAASAVLPALASPAKANMTETTVIPYHSTGYKYKVVQHGAESGFEQPDFDDSGFSTGGGGFGTSGYDGMCTQTPLKVNTDWPGSTDLLLRKSFELPEGATDVKVSVAIDNDIQVFLNGQDISGGVQTSDNCAINDRYTFTAPSGVPATGTNTLAVRASDRGAPNYVDVKVSYSKSSEPDTEAPRATLDLPGPGAIVGGEVLFSARASDNVQVKNVLFKINGATVAIDDTEPYSAVWYSNFSDMPDGEVTASATAFDTSNNHFDSNTRTIFLDNTPPPVPNITSPANGHQDEDGSFTVSGTVEAGSHVRLYEGTKKVGAWLGDGGGNWSISLDDVPEGTHTYVAKALDGVHNESGPSEPINVVVNAADPDTTAPAVAITAPKDGTSYFQGQKVSASYSCSDEQGGSGVKSCTGTVPSGSAIDTATAGAKTFSVTATDNAGNTKTVARSYTVVAPQTFQETDRDRVSYGGWGNFKSTSYSGGYSAFSRTTNESATLRFTGTSVSWITSGGTDRGIAKVILDAGKPTQVTKTFDAYSSSFKSGVVGFSKTGLPSGAHTLKVVVTGNKRAASTNAWVGVDRFLVNGTTSSLQENHPSIAYGPWVGLSNASALGGTYRESRSASVSAFSFYFSGPYVDLITAKGPSRGVAKIEAVDADTGAVAKTVKPNLNAASVQWRTPVRIALPDPTRRYFLRVTSFDGKPVVVDAFRGFPPKTSSAASSRLSAAGEGGGTSPAGPGVSGAPSTGG